MSANGAKRTMKLPDRKSPIHRGANLANGHQVLDSIHSEQNIAQAESNIRLPRRVS
jgi:hypothetical protein